MTLRTRIARTILFSLLALAVAAWAYTAWDTGKLHEGLAMVRDTTVLEYQRHALRMGNGQPFYEVVGVVTTAREHGVWGKGVGKIVLYTRKAKPEGGYDRGGVEFFYEYDESAAIWRLKDSIGMHGPPPSEATEAAFLEAAMAGN